jgi:hypothetical protein
MNDGMNNGQADETDTPVGETDMVMTAQEADEITENLIADEAMQDEGDALVLNQEGVASETDPISAVYAVLPPTQEQTPLEAAAHALCDEIARLRDDGGASLDTVRLLNLADTLEDAAVRSEAARLATPVLLEVTGNVKERELAARYCEQKVKGALFHAGRDHRLRNEYALIADTFRATASDFRAGLHLPEIVLGEGKVIPYNESNDTGMRHANGINALVTDVHARNVKAGWWHDLATSQPLARNDGELICLMHSELSEAMEGVRKNLMDDHLPDRPMVEVEMADCVIRIADYCGGRGLDLGGAIDDKLLYNATRADHKVENRLKDDGKKF